MSLQVKIIGSSHAGANVAYNLRRDGFEGDIEIISTESFPPYHRPPLSKDFLKGKTEKEKLTFKPEAFYADNQITLTLDTEVLSIDRAAKTIETLEGTSAYDFLVLCTGSSPRKLNLENADLPEVLYLRDLQDAETIKEKLADASHITLLGGGYIGLELASAIRELDIEVCILELEDRILKRVTTAEVSDFYHQYHANHGVDIRCSTGLEEIVSESGALSKLKLSDGTELKTDALIVGIGAIPNVGLAEAVGIAHEGGIHVDEYCRTSDPLILAAGDCTNHQNKLFSERMRLESVPNALAQAKVVSSSIIGNDLTYKEMPWFWSDQYDLKLQMVGISRNFDEVHIIGSTEDAEFLACYGKEGSLIAVDSVNMSKPFMLMKKALSGGSRIPMEVIKDKDFKPENIFSGSS